MHIHTIHTGNFKLDGGAMFGVVPKVLWQKHVPADANNLCTWAMRSMLVEHGNRLLLVDTGIGNKQSEKFFSHYHLHGDMSLDGELQKRGFTRNDITDVLLTHLHFDHVGGSVERNKEGNLRPAFPNACILDMQAALGLGDEPQSTGKSIIPERKPHAAAGKWTTSFH